MDRTIVKDIDSRQLRDYMERAKEGDFLLVDVREPKEYKQAHIPGAILIPLKEVETSITDYDVERDLIFYCRSGRRSRLAAHLVEDMGIPAKNIWNLSGGILSWRGEKLPDFPRIEVFSDKTKISEILMKAFEMEKGTRQFYLAASSYMADKALSKDITSLARLEVEHARLIFKHLKKERSDLGDFETLFETAPATVMEGGLSMEEAVKRISEMHGDYCINFGEFALEIELMAYDLYRNLSERAETKEAATAFLRLAEQEKTHARVVSRIIEKCMG